MTRLEAFKARREAAKEKALTPIQKLTLTDLITGLRFITDQETQLVKVWNAMPPEHKAQSWVSPEGLFRQRLVINKELLARLELLTGFPSNIQEGVTNQI